MFVSEHYLCVKNEFSTFKNVFLDTKIISLALFEAEILQKLLRGPGGCPKRGVGAPPA